VLAQFGWARFLRQHHHSRFPSLSKNIGNIPHPAAAFLQRLATHGVPAPSSTPPWSLAQKDTAVQRGPHPSASKIHTTFLLEDMYDMVRMGYWVVLPYSAVRHYPQLKIAPSGVVPQRERRPRPIMDYSYNEVNQTSLPVAPTQAMQFGQALQRILQRLAYCNTAYGPPVLAKIDMADVYYRVPLSQTASLQLAVVLPNDGLSEPLLGLPLSLPMGWSHSPPYFCAFTETCTDLTNQRLLSHWNHPFNYASPTATDISTTYSFHPTALLPYNPNPPSQPLRYADVYIDDFMLVAQQPVLNQAMNTLLHHINSIFQDPDDSPRRLLVSASKVEKGDATFLTQKRILGWDINTETMTIHLPHHRLERILDITTTFRHKKLTTRKQWQKLLGELRSMTLALHSSAHLFSVLQHVLQGTSRKVRIPKVAHQALQDWQDMAQNIAQHPVPITSLVPHAPHYVSTSDASQDGMGGMWLPTRLIPDGQPCVWRAPFHPNIKTNLVSHTNPRGIINNSELELAAAVLGHAIQLSHTPTHCYTNTYLGTDNTAAQAWLHNGSVTSIKAPAKLLRQLAHTCRHHNARLTAIHVNGLTNTIADFLSRSFHLSDTELLDALQQMAPIQPPWKLVTPAVTWVCDTNWALLNRHPATVFRELEPVVMTQRGAHGATSATPFTKTLFSRISSTPCPSSKSMLTDTEWGRWLPPALRLKLEQWRQPFARWARRSPSWDTQTHACKHQENWTYASTGNYNTIPSLTRLQQE